MWQVEALVQKKNVFIWLQHVEIWGQKVGERRLRLQATLSRSLGEKHRVFRPCHYTLGIQVLGLSHSSLSVFWQWQDWEGSCPRGQWKVSGRCKGCPTQLVSFGPLGPQFPPQHKSWQNSPDLQHHLGRVFWWFWPMQFLHFFEVLFPLLLCQCNCFVELVNVYWSALMRFFSLRNTVFCLGKLHPQILLLHLFLYFSSWDSN